ncbi:hypothetical protein NQ317_010873 [Molorchus minor]|uniref:Acyl-coenzyme A oxidase n=1 Tax=Molorchus minor TaxID=1323400 RepID=A0ABQ9JE84_9CUCU|nr:hypothetical protein NQ317_010873 [Molorchus minor]
MLNIPDFIPGPLDFYRSRASFDWKKLKLFLESERDSSNDVYEELQKHSPYNKDFLSLQSLDDVRHVADRQTKAYKNIELLSLGSTILNLRRPATATRIMMQLAPASTIKYSVSNILFTSALINMGTDRHLRYVDDISGCYCLTEIGHGSNTRGMKTTATYNEDKKQFVLNSQNFEAAKCWVGGLGQGATHAIVYAQLILKNTNYGLHAFVVPIRDPATFLPYPGLTVGDMGEKIGLNGIDNGFVCFNGYQIPRVNLLNKLGDVTEDGKYVTPIKDPNKRHGAALGSLSGGRVNITCICEAMGIKALTIAIRYAGVRKQFGPFTDEVPILEYQSHQYRLIPYLAAAYSLRIFNNYFTQIFYQFSMDSLTGHKGLSDLGTEIHAISSCCKPLAGWVMRDAIQECREACGGHGYLKASGIGDVRNDHDANLTYEGENHVLIQQTSNWLLKISPLESVNFLSNAIDILRKKFVATTIEELCVPEYVLSIYKWLTCYLLKTSYEQLELELQKSFLLYGLWSLEKHIPILYQGGFTQGPAAVTLIQNGILRLCSDLKDNAVSLVDAVAPPDFILNSVLGASDGMVYKHLQSSIFNNSYCMERPKWWQEIIKFDQRNNNFTYCVAVKILRIINLFDDKTDAQLQVLFSTKEIMVYNMYLM